MSLVSDLIDALRETIAAHDAMDRFRAGNEYDPIDTKKDRLESEILESEHVFSKRLSAIITECTRGLT